MTKKEIIEIVRKQRVKKLFTFFGLLILMIFIELLLIVLLNYLIKDNISIKYYSYLMAFFIPIQLVIFIYLYKRIRRTRIDISDEEVLKSFEAKELIKKYGLKDEEEIDNMNIE